MTPRLAELLAAMVDAVLASEAVAPTEQRATIRHSHTRRRRAANGPGKAAQEERGESRASG